LEDKIFVSSLLLPGKEKGTPVAVAGSWQLAEGNKFRCYLASASEEWCQKNTLFSWGTWWGRSARARN